METSIKRDNRTAQVKNMEKSIFLHTSSIDTIIKLLYCPEQQIINDALIALNRYAINSTDNLNELYEMGIMQALLHIIINGSTMAKVNNLRFAMKLLSMLIQLPYILNELKENITLVKKTVSFLTSFSDEILHEYAAVTLSYLTINTNVAKEVYKIGLLELSWNHVFTGNDLDILNASLQIIINFLDVENVIDSLFRFNNFKFDIIYNLFTNNYVQIQENSLKLMLKIVSLANCSDIHFYVVQNEFFIALFQILENNSNDNLHGFALDILSKVLAFEETVIYFLEMEYCPQFLTYAESLPVNRENSQLLVKLCEIITEIGNIEYGRHELYVLCVDKFLLTLLKFKSIEVDINLKACQGIHAMVKHPKAVKLFAVDSCVATILGLLPTPAQWSTNRQYPIEALTYIIWSQASVTEYLTTPPMFEILLKSLSNNWEVIPAEVFLKYIYICQPFILCKSWYTCTLKTRLLDTLHFHLNNHPSDKIKTAVLNVLMGFMCENGSVEWCLKSECYLKLIDCLKSNNYPLVYASIDFINQLCKNRKLSYLFIKYKLLPILQTRTNEFVHYPEWRRTLENLYNSHLPSKFHYLGRLDVTDITKEQFYVAKRPMKELPILEDLLRKLLTPFDIIYTATFTYRSPPIQLLNELLGDQSPVQEMIDDWKIIQQNLVNQRKYAKCRYPLATKSECSIVNESDDDIEMQNSLISSAKSKKQSLRKGTLTTPKDQKIYQRQRSLADEVLIQLAKADQKAHKAQSIKDTSSDTSFQEIAPRLMSWIGCLPPDPILPSYLDELSELFNSNPYNKSGMSSFNKLLKRIKVLAKYVHTHTCGPTNDDVFLKNSVQLEHLNRIKYKYGSNFIPIGLVKIGNYLERSMLFKVLADRLQIPATMVRGRFGRAWNEVPLFGNVLEEDNISMTNNDEENDQVTDVSEYEGPLLYYIVDLIKYPGKLYPLGSQEAINYCTAKDY